MLNVCRVESKAVLLFLFTFLLGEITLLMKKIKEDEDEIYKLKKVISESRIPCARKAPNIKEVNIQPTRASVLRAQRNQKSNSAIQCKKSWH